MNLDIIPSTPEWDKHQRDLKKLMQNEFWHDFLKWPVVRRTMFHTARKVEYDYIISEEVDHKLLIEDKIGKPDPYPHCKESSGNLIHHIYSMLKLDLPLFELDSIFELGGGYGSLCRVISRMGFDGEYSIYDLPVFLYLQRYFLTKVGILNVHFLTEVKPKSVGLFVSLWALSECPMDLRIKVFNEINADNYLIAFQGSFSGIDNVEFFEKFAHRKPYIKWKLEKIEHLKDSYYLIGKK